ncbi:MAG: energy-coupling factor transporter ATPase [Bacilli bacterium]|nr:energy-coupling factor transporter ATPase [Bacilli bacterium]
MSNIIEINNLSFSYEEGSKTLDGVSFVVEEGSYVTLIGHNGSGKSTLAKVISGLVDDFTGEVKVFGLDVDRKNIKEIRAKLGLVFQNPDNQFVGSTVRDDMAFGLENRCIPTEEMNPIIEKFAAEAGMSEFLDTAPENLSGGQKQRVAIAGILSMSPDLIIYDEATSMLDPVGKKDILRLTLKLKEENPKLTVFSITHDVEEAWHADKVLVLNKGHLVLEGTPKEVFSHSDELEKIHLEAPFIVSLIKALRNNGINVPDNISSEEELEDYLCR